MNFQYFFNLNNILVSVSLILGIINFALLISVLIRLRRIFRGSDGKSIESFLNSERKTIADLIRYKEESTKYLSSLDLRIKSKVSSVEASRFNPFHGAGIGGNNSFSVSLLDEKGKGIVLSGLHSRERMNVFVKPIQNWNGEIELSDEEKAVLNKTKDALYQTTK